MYAIDTGSGCIYTADITNPSKFTSGVADYNSGS